MLPEGKIWKEDKTGDLFHDSCFEADETREGFTAIGLDEIEEGETCKSCGGPFADGDEPDDDDDEDDDEDDE